MTLARYILVQIVAYGLDLGGFYALFSTGVASPVVANVGGKILAGLFAFFAHRSFTFGVQGPERRVGHAVKYFALLAINTPVSSAILAGLLLFMSHVTAAKVIADALSVGLTFLLTKHVVFTHEHAQTCPLRGRVDHTEAQPPAGDLRGPHESAQHQRYQ